MRHNEVFINSLNSSQVKKNKFLYVYFISLTIYVMPGVVSALPRALNVLISLVLFIFEIIALFKLAPSINAILQTSYGIIFQKQKIKSSGFRVLMILFFIWVLGLPSFITIWITPHILDSETLTPGIEMVIVSFFAGPTEEIWRWATIIGLYYVGIKIFAKSNQHFVFWTSILISCALFGLGHIGQVKGHDLYTWLMLSLSGLLLSLFAYVSGSLWIAVIVHSSYDLIVSLGVASIPKIATWWISAGMFGLVIGSLYYKLNIRFKRIL